jgi:hypothetical protein
MHLVELTVADNEASDLLRVKDQALLAELGAQSAFWTVLDEGPVEKSLALIVHSPQGDWSAHHVAAQAGEQAGRTEDAEALAHHDGWVYVLGSHFGSKKGPLQPKRAFVARFRESVTPVLQIVRHRFALHRAVNDALAELTGPAHAPVHESFIAQARERGLAKGKSWVEQLQPGDHPINVEGAAFTARGTLLIGLRWPVTITGEPILVELAGVPELFSGGTLSVVGAHVLAGAGPGPLGVRALCAREEGGFDVVIGSIDAPDKGSVLLENYPQARDASCRHFRFALGEGSPVVINPELIADLAPLHHVEGIAEWQGRSLYVTDEDHRVALYAQP